jgi:hypothetical protein
MGYWESLDEEFREQQLRLPWYRREWSVCIAFYLALVLFTLQFIYVLKSIGRWLLSLF